MGYFSSFAFLVVFLFPLQLQWSFASLRSGNIHRKPKYGVILSLFSSSFRRILHSHVFDVSRLLVLLSGDSHRLDVDIRLWRGICSTGIEGFGIIYGNTLRGIKIQSEMSAIKELARSAAISIRPRKQLRRRPITAAWRKCRDGLAETLGWKWSFFDLAQECRGRYRAAGALRD